MVVVVVVLLSGETASGRKKEGYGHTRPQKQWR